MNVAEITLKSNRLISTYFKNWKIGAFILLAMTMFLMVTGIVASLFTASMIWVLGVNDTIDWITLGFILSAPVYIGSYSQELIGLLKASTGKNYD